MNAKQRKMWVTELRVGKRLVSNQNLSTFVANNYAIMVLWSKIHMRPSFLFWVLFEKSVAPPY
nr:MAG TPA: hypothetical protein [Bacteriophage sp.]